MTGNELSANLGLRLEDPAASVFTSAAKVDAINMGQKTVVNMVDNSYLSELQTASGTVAVTAGSLSYGVAFPSGGNPIRNGIIGVKDITNSLWCTMVEPQDIKRLENSYLNGSAQNPVAYAFNEVIYVSGGATQADVWYIQSPTDYDSTDATGGAGGMAYECELNPALQELVLDFAEAQLWRMDAKPDRAAAAYSNALNVIKVLNERYQVEKPEGIGTKGR